MTDSGTAVIAPQRVCAVLRGVGGVPMRLDGLPERVCGHCGSRAFRIPVGSERPVLACRYCGKITMLDASDGQAEPGAGHESACVGASPRPIRPPADALSGVRGSRQAVPVDR
jgi:hypothetical protein